MFTGIVTDIGEITSVTPGGGHQANPTPELVQIR